MSEERNSGVVVVEQPDTASMVVLMRRVAHRRRQLQLMQDALKAEPVRAIAEEAYKTPDAVEASQVEFVNEVKFVERAQDQAVSFKFIRVSPGAHTLAFFGFLLSKRKFELLIQQSVADMREEYFEALAAGQRRKAVWVRIRGTYSVWAAVAMDAPISVIRMAVKIWKASN